MIITLNNNTSLKICVVTICRTFTDKDTDSLHTQKTRQLFYQPEEDFWLIMVLVHFIHKKNLKKF